jgi:hypothetical protein
MKKTKKLYLICLSVFIMPSIFCGCSTMSDSLILGVGTGAAVGGIIGHNSESQDAGAGAAIGAAVGGLASYVLFKRAEKNEERVRRETLLNLEKYDVSSPRGQSRNSGESDHLLTKPVVDMDWVETQVQGDKLIEGHRVWRIIEKPKWIPGKSQPGEGK